MSTTVVPLAPPHLPGVREIFFESSSRKSFRDDEERELFFRKYVGFYVDGYPELCLVALRDGVVRGYLVGAPASGGEELLTLQPHLTVFQREFEAFPAHLHINCHRDARGQGIGGSLMEKFEALLREMNIAGLHIMTAPDSPNKCFYRRLGFHREVLEDFKGSPILFMGKKLSAE
jgi:ribosomal protein S18 acetylase RimI-like enzyme